MRPPIRGAIRDHILAARRTDHIVGRLLGDRHRRSGRPARPGSRSGRNDRRGVAVGVAWPRGRRVPHWWLVNERGLAPTTVLRYENLARRFLEQCAAVSGAGFIQDLAGTDVVAFLVAETQRVSIGASKGRVAELRSLLKFLYLKGYTVRAC